MASYTHSQVQEPEITAAYRKLEAAYRQLQTVQSHLRSAQSRSMYYSGSSGTTPQELLRLSKRAEQAAAEYESSIRDYVESACAPAAPAPDHGPVPSAARTRS